MVLGTGAVISGPILDLKRPSHNPVGMSVASSVQVKAQVAMAEQPPTSPAAPADQAAAELAQLSQIIRTWRELNKETTDLKAEVREKTKRLKALEEMILRIMKRHNIGALDLTSSGGRLLYRRQNAKATLGQKDMMRLLSEHLKSEDKAAEALKFITEHRGTRVRETLFYEKD